VDTQNKKRKNKRADRAQIDQFKKDVGDLMASGLTQTKIAEKMGAGDTNFSNYLKEAKTHPITENFLKRFYEAWGEELKGLHEKPVEPYPNELSPETATQEEEAKTYTVKYYSDQLIDILKKNNDVLLNNMDKMIETNQKLASNNEKLVESNNKLVEFQLIFMGQQGEKPENRPEGM
jgi:predicted transcriptional regulator